MKFAICNETYEGWDFQTACADIAESGYDAVEIAPFTLDDDPTKISESRARKFGDLVKASGLTVTGFHWLLQKPEGLHLTCPDIEIRQRTKEVLQHLARICAATGGRLWFSEAPNNGMCCPAKGTKTHLRGR
jgi:sugar phosphate isomerase/epimerase